MSQGAVAHVQRFTKSFPCPICGGGKDDPKGRGKRCAGFLSSDGRFARCTREEFAGELAFDLDTDPPTFLHFLEGDCQCGQTHGYARAIEVAAYDYVDADGELLYQAVRYMPKDFRQRRPDGAGGWIHNLQGVERVLYRLPRVLAAVAAGETIYVVEGEKDVAAVESAGAVGTCNAMGAGKWRPEYAETLRGARRVVVVADQDPVGLAHAQAVVASLEGKVDDVSLCVAASGRDVSDHLAELHTLDELVPYIGVLNGDLLETDSWTPRNLALAPDAPLTEPTLGGIGLLYPGKRHVFSGPQESAKTLAAYVAGLCVVREGGRLMLIDFEMGEIEAKRRLRELGATDEELGAIDYIEPEEKITDEIAARLVARNPALVIVDASAGAYDLQGFDDNKRQDVERFASSFMRPFWKAKIATLVIDHVVKNVEARGNYVIGSERKVGGVDVHLGFSVITPIKRGAHGRYQVTTHKDRGGFHKRGKLATFELASDPETHHFTWAFVAALITDEEHPFRPTGLMEKASVYIELATEPPSKNKVVGAIEGKSTDYKRLAIERLIHEEYVETFKGARNADLLRSIRPYRESVDNYETTSPLTSPDLASNGEENDLASSPLSSRERRGDGRLGGGGEVDEQSALEDDDGIPF